MVTIEVGGVGLLVHTTNRVSSSLVVGKSSNFLTTLIVREDSLTLYGFLDSLELGTFDHLRSVSGVGPKSALSILSVLSVSQIADAVANDSDSVFKSVPGVGAKTAKLITISLAGKFLPRGDDSVDPGKSRAGIEALVGLGYSESEATLAVSKVADSKLTDKEVLKLALQYLAKGVSK
jgi:Holliday junction DNA helicase RuvA